MNPVPRSLLGCGLAVLLAACVTPQATAGTMDVSILVDDQSLPLSVPAGSTVQQVLQQAEVELGQLDLVEPPGYTVLTGGSQVSVTRRTERFEIEQIVIPFSRQTVSNEGLPAGETRLLQPGENGLEEITYRVLEEEGIEVSRQPAQRMVVQEPRAEILMVGTEAFHTPVAIEGRLALLSAGNAWVLEGDSTNRRPVVVSGDLDGQVFQLSPDGRWLLFSRRTEEDDQDFNGLWVVARAVLHHAGLLHGRAAALRAWLAGQQRPRIGGPESVRAGDQPAGVVGRQRWRPVRLVGNLLRLGPRRRPHGLCTGGRGGRDRPAPGRDSRHIHGRPL